MIAFLRGRLFSIQESSLILDVQGVGYWVQIPANLALPALGEDLMLYTHQIWREDTLALYGFASEQDLNLFKFLLRINGIGPKGALGLISAVGSEGILRAVSSENTALLAKAPGIGRKTAQRLILELKDKLKNQVTFESEGISRQTDSEAVEALLGLGYSLPEANQAIKLVMQKQPQSLEDMLSLALQELGRQKI